MDIPRLLNRPCALLHEDGYGTRKHICTCHSAVCAMVTPYRPTDDILQLQIRHERTKMYNNFASLIGHGPEPLMTCDEAVCWLIEQHRSFVDQTNRCRQQIEHDILYIGAKLALNFRLKTPGTIRDLLSEMYRCEGDFVRLVLGAIYGPKFIIRGWRNEFRTRKECFRALHYFLRLSTKYDIRFMKDGSLLRMVDLPLMEDESPLEAAKRTRAKDVYKLLIKYKNTPTTIQEENESPDSETMNRKHEEKRGEHEEQRGEHEEEQGEHVEQRGEHEEQRSEHEEQQIDREEQQNEHEEQQGELEERGEHEEKQGEHEEQRGEHVEQRGEHVEQRGEHEEQQNEREEQRGEHEEQQNEHEEQQNEREEQQNDREEQRGEHEEQQNEHEEQQNEHEEEEVH